MVNDSTSIGGQGVAFPQTSWSLVRAAADPSSPARREKLSQLIAIYWKPVYHYVRRSWKKSNEEAKDLTQGFFSLLLEGDYLKEANPSQGTLRGYLKAALGHFLVDESRREEALKRGGGMTRRSLETPEIRELLIDLDHTPPEEAFDREWILVTLAEATRELETALLAEGRQICFTVYSLYYPELQDFVSGRAAFAHKDREPEPSPTYEEVGVRLGLKPHEVSYYLSHARQRLRAILARRVADTALSEEEALAELRFILGG